MTLEQNIAEALNWSGRRTDAVRTGELLDHGRFDIAVCGSGSTSIVGIVEIKEVKFVTYACSTTCSGTSRRLRRSSNTF